MTPEDMQRAYNNIVKIVQAFDDGRSESCLAMIDDLGDQLITCPASDRDDRGLAVPGGLMAHMLMVANKARRLAPVLAPDVSATSLMVVSLFHDIGRVGDPSRRMSYYIPEEDAWRREKLGKNYRYNEQFPKMAHSARSLFVLSHYAVKLTVEEWIAIQTCYGFGLEENRFYVGDDRPLTVALQTAVRAAMCS